jgi:DNA-binding NtrC family response regulator
MLNHDLSLLLSINDDIANISDYQVLLPTIITKLCKLCSVEEIGMTFFDETREKVASVIATLSNGPNFHSSLWYQSFSLKSLPFELPLQNPQIVQIDASNFYGMKKFNSEQEDIAELLKKKMIDKFYFIPMQTGGVLSGFIMLPLHGSVYNENDDMYLMRAANLIASAMKNFESYFALKRRNEEKEIQINLFSELTDLKTGDSFFKILANEITKLIPCEYIAIHGQRYSNNDLKAMCLLKEEGSDKFTIINMTRSIVLSFMTLESKIPLQNGIAHAEIKGAVFEKLCEQYIHLKQLKEKDSIASILVFRLAKKDEGEINFLLGRSRPYNGKDEIGIRLWQNPDSFFLSSEIEFGAHLLPHLASVIGNFYTFEEITVLTKKLEQEKNYLLDEINLTNNFQQIVGTSAAIQHTLNKVKQVAPLDATVLIQGETGTGKELVARAVHNLSKRKEHAFITVNCAALPAPLIESELFGHEKGSFTGAVEKRIGKFEVADGGTIFLDEIGELPLEIQAKLLRVLQEKEFERLGGKSTVVSDVRIVAATNRDLEKEVASGKFRADLFFRLNVFPIVVPPLRDRKDDIPLLVKYFIDQYSIKIGKEVKSIKKNDLEMLEQYHWPGNIRELEHFIERAIIISDGSNLNLEKQLTTPPQETETDFQSFKTLVEIEKEHIVHALKITNGKVTGDKSAAQLLGLNGKTLGSKMRKLGIRREIVITAEIQQHSSPQ